MPKFAGEVTINQSELDRFLRDPAGPVGDHLSRLGRQVYTVARNMAPISPHGSHGRPPGFLKTRIDWRLELAADGLSVVVTSPATTGDGRNAPYGSYQNIPNLTVNGHRIKTTPHLEPALRYVMDLQ